MTRRTVGALFAGYGGLELGLSQLEPTRLAWYAEIEPGAAAIMAHHYPGVPNLGDVTTVDWSAVEPVDVITGGSPCQDLSHAGKRAGMRAGTRSGLWAAMTDAIDIIRPDLVVWENVRGALSAQADSQMEQCPRCLGGTEQAEPVLRALGRVLGDLADLGFDAEWHGLPASSVGAPHGRFRIFLAAHPADADGQGLQKRRHPGSVRAASPATPATTDGDCGARSDLTLLPTPVSDNSRGLPSTGTDYASLANVAVSLLPTPRSQNGEPRNQNIWARPDDQPQNLENALANTLVTWGDYAPAIARWETATGRPAPAPTEPGTKGGHRLSPRFVEWMMGLDAGWVTDVPGITRNQALKALGNGVVPRQAAAALRAMA